MGASGSKKVRVDGDYDYVDRVTRQRRVTELEQDAVYSESVEGMRHGITARGFREGFLDSCACTHVAGDPLASSIILKAMDMADRAAREPDTLHQDWQTYGAQPLYKLLDARDASDAADKMKTLASKVEQIVEGEPILLRVDVSRPYPAQIFGDIHGQFRDLLLWLQDFGFPHEQGPSFIFNGDWVDRGRHQLEVIALIFACKITFPKNVFLIRGNHEFPQQNIHTGEKGFFASCKALGPPGPGVFEAIHTAFESLPLACLLGESILIIHGGIGDGNWDLEDLENVERPIDGDDAAANLMVYNILWSDPAPEKNEQSFGVHTSPRDGHSNMCKTFGKDVTEAFCERNNIEMIVRSHQEKVGGCGYEVMHGDRLVRVFSARDYEGQRNDGATMKVRRSRGGKLVIRAQLLQTMAKAAQRLGNNSRLAARPLMPTPNWCGSACGIDRDYDEVDVTRENSIIY